MYAHMYGVGILGSGSGRSQRCGAFAVVLINTSQTPAHITPNTDTYAHAHAHAHAHVHISQTELIAFLNDLGERPTRAEAAMWMTKLDTDNTGSIEQDELVDSLLVYVKAKVRCK